MTATVNSGPSSAPAYWPNPEWSHIATQLRVAIEVFVLAEPFVHVAIGHQQTASVFPLPSIHPRAESYLWTEEQRLECFLMRIAVVASVFDKRAFPDKSLAYWAMQMFLFSLVTVEQVQAYLRGEPANEHSIARQELGWLVSALRHIEGDQSRSLATLERLAPIPESFAKHLDLLFSDSGSHLH